MNKKFLSAILFGALMVSSTGTFVSCKDYDDDIDRIDKELTDLKSQIAALQSKIDAGKYITSVDKTDKGLTFTLNDGSSYEVTNGVDGEKGEKGDGNKLTIDKDGQWLIDEYDKPILDVLDTEACFYDDYGKQVLLEYRVLTKSVKMAMYMWIRPA
jgi:hypothetical protein